jgi:cytochrome c2
MTSYNYNDKEMQCYSNLKCCIILILFISTISCKENKDDRTQKEANTHSKLVKKEAEIYVDLTNLLGNKNNNNALTVEVKYDHYFKSPKKYKGFLITTLIDSIIKSNNFDTAHALVVFECNDGYKPVMDISKIFGNTKGYVVYKDVDPTIKGNWADSIYKKFNPYYVVWDDVKKNDNSFAWPYGLVGLRLTYIDIVYESVYPFNDPSLIKGFNLYRNNCMKCHSINKTGGTMGPEFNVPKNITEYWKEEDIIAFAKNPGAYRIKSEMPAISNIKDSDFKQLLSYIKYMKDYKTKH